MIFISCSIFIITLLRFFSFVGLSIYVAVATIVANIQVLKAGQLSFYSDPVALGTIVFSSTYLATDILTECFGRKKARDAVWLGFISMLFISVTMNLTIGVAPIVSDCANACNFNAAHNAMSVLFTPAPAIFMASMVAYITSQMNDIWLFALISKLTNKRFLFLRSFISTAVSSLLDNIIFSVLAWKVFAINPIDNQTLIWSYIIGTYILRLIMSFVNIPMVYLGRYIVNSSNQGELK